MKRGTFRRPSRERPAPTVSGATLTTWADQLKDWVSEDAIDHAPEHVVLGPYREPSPVPKPAAPSRSEAYKAFVRTKKCCNCQRPPPSDPDHVGSRGVGQKCSDFLCVPLCRPCHDFRTHNGYLPRNGALPLHRQMSGAIVEQYRQETRLLVAETQRDLLVEWESQKD